MGVFARVDKKSKEKPRIFILYRHLNWRWFTGLSQLLKLSIIWMFLIRSIKCIGLVFDLLNNLIISECDKLPLASKFLVKVNAASLSRSTLKLNVEDLLISLTYKSSEQATSPDIIADKTIIYESTRRYTICFHMKNTILDLVMPS